MHALLSLLLAQTTLQLDDGTMEQMWSLTSPNAGPNDWVAVAYTPPFEHPFRVVSATMFYLDDSCCNAAGSCSSALCLSGADWERRVIASAQLTVDPAGLTPNLASPVHSQTSVMFTGPGANFTTPPWSLTPNVWTMPAGIIFDRAGRIFYAIKYNDNDQYMRFAVDDDGPNPSNGAGVYTTDGFTSRSAIWSFGNVGMRIAIEPIFFLKVGTVPPQAMLTLDGATSVTMLSLRAGGGTAATSVSRVRVTAAGSGNDALGVASIRLVHDANRNGIADVGETALASGTYAADNGFVDLFPNRTVAAGTTEEWVVVYDFNTQPAGGQTFSARIAAAADVDSNLGDPYVSGTTGGTGAINGPVITIGGRLSVSRGAASPPARVVATGGSNVPVLQVRLTSYDEAFSLTRLRFTASGSLNDLTEITNVRLHLDANGDGAAGGGDTLLASGVLTQDDGAIDMTFAAVTIGANLGRDFLVTVDLAGAASGGDTLRMVLAAPSDVGATGTFSGAIPISGPRALAGAPVIGELQTVGGALTVALGAANPPAGTAQPASAAIPMLQLSLTAQAEAIALTSLTFTGSGTGNEATHVLRARLFRDVNGNGLVEGTDVVLGQPQAFAANDGIITFAISGESVPASASRSYLVAYDFTAAPTGGETFALRMASNGGVIATGSASGAPIAASGNFPLNGNARTVLGGLSISLAAENPPAANVQPGTSDVAVLALRVAAQGETFTVTSLSLTGAGSLLDHSAILAVELWRDAGTLGARDPADTLIATSNYPSDDGAALFTFSRAVASGATERWLVTYDLQLSAQSGQTFRATIASNGVTATGSLSGFASPTGLPLTGNTLAIGGTLALTAGPLNPLGGSILPGQSGVVMMQARLTASLEPITVTGLTFTGAGTGNEMTSVSAARLFVDADRDGQLDAVGDVALGGPRAFALNDGTVSFSFPGRTIAAGANEDWIVVYDFAAGVAAGQTFSLTWMNATDAVASAPSGMLPRATGAPLSAGAKTVLGTLAVARGPANPAPMRVRRDATSAPVLQLRLTSQAEVFSVSSLALAAAGSIDDVADLTRLRLLLDADGNGVESGSDSVLGSAAFSADDGALTFSSLGVMLPAGGSTDLLVVADFSGTAAGGTTLRLNLAAGGLTATGFGGRTTSNGAALSSETITMGGTLDVTLGPQSPIARIVVAGEPSVPALQLRVRAGVEPATLTSLTVHAFGTGDDAAAIAAVGLVLDGDGNGRVGAGEPQLGSGAFTQNDGAITFPLSQPIQVGPAIHLLVTVSMSSSPIGGETFSLEIDPIADLSITSSSNAVVVVGLPLTGALLTAGGGFEVALGAESSPGATVNQSVQNVPVLQLDMRSVNEACTIQSLTLRAFGSIDDQADVAAVRLLHDANDNGLVDFADQQIGTPAIYQDDDGTITFTSLSRALGTGASERWIVSYDLAGSASNLQTFAVRLEDDADVSVSCSVSGPVIATGAPLESGTFTIQEDGALVIARGAETPPSLFLPAGSVKSPLLQLRASATVQDLTLDRIVLTATVSAGATADTIARISLFEDVNQDGLLDRGDRELSPGAAPDAAGRVELSALSLLVPVAEAAFLLATVDVASNAAPGTRFSIGLADNADADARSSFGTAITTGAPAFSDGMTVAGRLNLAAGDAAPKTVRNDAAAIEALAFSAVAISETFHLRSITVTAEGTLDPAAGIRGITLMSGGRALAEGAIFPEGSPRTTFAGLDEAVAPGATVELMVLVDLEGTARVDQTLVLSIAANVDVLAAGDDVGLTSPIGAPIVGSPIAIGPSLELSPGAPVPDVIVAANADSVPVMSFTLSAFNEGVTVSRLSLSTSGSLDDAGGIDALHLVLDVDGDGSVDPEDPEVARPARPAGDDGMVTFAPLAENLAQNTSARYLVTLDLSGSGSAGDEVQVSIASDGDLTAFGAESGAVAARGAPLAGARVTLVGALSVRLGPASPPGVGVSAGSSFSALQLEAFTQGESVIVEALVLRIEGTAEDSTAILDARLYRDLDEDGAIGAADSLEANAVPDGDDGLIAFNGLSSSIDADAKAFYLVELELAADAASGGTIRLTLESNDRLRATGASSGAVDAVGAPIAGSAFTIVSRGEGGPSPEDGCGCTAAREGNATPWLLLALLLRTGAWRRRGLRWGGRPRA